MAIWDDMTTSKKCPNCASNIFFDEHFQKLTCRACGSFFDPDTMELSYKLKQADKAPAAEDDHRLEYTCGSCGAVVVTDETTAADICAFCGSPALVRSRLTSEFRPEAIIPFKFSKSDAEEKFMAWAKTFKKAPKSFKSHGSISKIQGVYVPFWLVDAKCTLEYREQYVDKFRRTFDLRRVPFDGSKGIPDSLMRAIEPFNFEELVPYNDGYLHGFRARRYNNSFMDMREQIFQRIEKYLDDMYHLSLKSDDYEFRNENLSFVDDVQQTYALLPVWFLNYEYDGELYQYAMNGQTGEVQGFDVPYSKLHYGVTYFKKGAMIALAAILILIAAIAFGKFAYNTFLIADESYLFGARVGVEFMLGAFFVVGLVGYILYKIIRAILVNPVAEKIKKPAYHIIDDAPDVQEYLDYQSIRNG